ncbi:related to ceramide glucosyltransferase [Cephalotrichum gorgonifer]|uniref:Ceramide glucosyltransferase n=1 Tax=Cephalotrichum gorgonifer TaxID=2041049 RepID=A0AAE8N5Q2_9PEZI|nr:related to ceramide glucosyltransferase [Cephalotrichum gorgonifer]
MLSTIILVAGYICLIWSFFILVVHLLKYSSPPGPAVSPTLPRDHVPHVTVIRPVKGLEPRLYECLASTFQQDYPADKLTVYLCVAETSDPAYPVLKKLVADFPAFDARVLIETDDPFLHGADGHVNNLGPNPKIRNISRAYREAKGDIVWVMDCNVWIPRATTGHMVDKLLGFRPGGKVAKPYKFVHQLPLVVDTSRLTSPAVTAAEQQSLLAADADADAPPKAPAATSRDDDSLLARLWNNAGGRLDEMFMSTTHAKFYIAINTVGVAPCVVGKSNMFRKSHIEALTDPAKNPDLPRDKRDHPVGIDYFSDYICEDHLIGDLLFRSHIPGHANHGLVLGDFAIQPLEGTSVAAYVGRRVRWLRARKWTVLAATLVEPGVESLICCAYLSFALTTIPWFHDALGIPRTWAAMSALWVATVSIWMAVDRALYHRLHGGGSVAVDEDTPSFARGTSRAGGVPRRSLLEWIPAWMMREILALPIWTWAVLLGTTVTWRGRTFSVRMDMSVVETGGDGHGSRRTTPEVELGKTKNKNRVD